jgi:anti-sigma regulatory factor (Ser/Thr protein kinase)
MESLTVEASLEALSAIGAFVREAAAEAGLDSRATYRLRLAVDEMATNIIVHGRPFDHSGDAQVLLTADIDDTTLTITLEDSGPAFNPLEHQTPDQFLDKPIDERPIGGLGVFLAIRGVDEFQYERLADRNRSKFIVRRGAGAGITT